MPSLLTRFLVLLILLCSCLTPSQAADVSELPITLQALIERSGRDNLIDLVQQGTANQAIVIQSGSDNSAYATQAGKIGRAHV